MYLYCPTCQATSAAVARCHRCGDRLVTPSETLPDSPDLPPPELIRPTIVGRVSIGTLVSLGIFLGLREWVAAMDPAEEWWSGAMGVSVIVILRALGVIVGGMMAGAGRQNGATTGASVGLITGAAFLVADVITGSGVLAVDGVAWAGLAVLAAASGQFGGRIWPAPADLPDPEPGRRSSSLARLGLGGKGEKNKLGFRPTVWVQIAAGAAVALAGVAAADSIRSGLKKGSAGMLNLGNPARAPLVDLQLAALGIGLAGLIAGSNTGAGLRHGLIAGAIAGSGIVALSVSGSGTIAPVVEGLLQVVDLPSDAPTTTKAIFTTFFAVLGGCMIGGWFGGQLLPPLLPAWLTKRRWTTL